ncbi:positive regulatory protein of phosphate pathway [Scheffersomyces coipomensis]|uniref:positive regulatory protein of phosphate pathway n=1 Tax=Scheffersomyces coipomensis TaxID=1788519 RepID=UPI00315D730F
MKFGKYLASRQLELPEYSGHFIDYKALKKLIKQLAIPTTFINDNSHTGTGAGTPRPLTQPEIQQTLKENKAQFFFRVERELDKVNSFYLEKQANLAINLDLLILKKNELLNKTNEFIKLQQNDSNLINANFRNSISYLNLYQNFKKIHQDLLRLQQFIELNETGFSKVVKKWDKRSKSHTKELFISTAVSVQPVFHKNEINELSDLVTQSLFDLESIMDGDYSSLKNYSSITFQNVPTSNPTLPIHQQPPLSLSRTNSNSNINMSEDNLSERHQSISSLPGPNNFQSSRTISYLQNNEIDELYTSFVNVATIKDPDLSLLVRWIDKVKSSSSTNPSSSKHKDSISSSIAAARSSSISSVNSSNPNTSIDTNNDTVKQQTPPQFNTIAKYKLTKIFLLAVSNLKISDSFLESFLKLIDYQIDFIFVNDDFNNNKSILHECCSIPLASTHESHVVINNGVKVVNSTDSINHSRTFIIKYIMNNISPEQRVGLLICKDFNGRTCLHYLSQHNRLDLLDLILPFFPPEHIDDLDIDSMSPLLLAIKHGYSTVIKKLVQAGSNCFPTNDENKLQYLPINYACKYGDYKIVEYLLSNNRLNDPNLINQQDVEGLLPLHVISRSGHYKLIKLLIQYGAEINKIDGLNKWTPIFYSASEGHVKTTQELVKLGAKLNIVDEDGYIVLYYCVVEGHIDVLNELLNHYSTISKSDVRNTKINNMNTIVGEEITATKQQQQEEEAQQQQQDPSGMSILVENDDDDSEDSGSVDKNNNNVDSIPDLQLPPPILPLRRYGHNFLEQKVLIELIFPRDADFINLFNLTTDLKPGRITITSNISDIVPRNILLPVADDTKTNNNNCVFQTDMESLQEFRIDFEVFPKFGTRLIAKTTALSFCRIDTSSPEINSIQLPLFDLRLRNIGELKFNYQVIFPFSGTLLETSKFDTYWKSSTSFVKNRQTLKLNAAGGLSPNNFLSPSSISSLIGNNKDKEKDLNTTGGGIIDGAVTSTNELVSSSAAPSSIVTATSLSGEYLRIKVCLLNDGTPVVCPHWSIAITENIDLYLPNLSLEQLSSITNDLFDYSKVIHDLSRMNIKDIGLIKKLLRIIYLPLDIFLDVLNLEINLNLEIIFPTLYELAHLPFIGNIQSNLDNFINFTLNDVFNHIRSSKLKQSTPGRSIIFLSSNSLICKILNWKQPNFPVFLIMSGITFNSQQRKFESRSANGLLVEDIRKNNSIVHDLSPDAKAAVNKNTGDKIISNHQEITIRSIKEAVNFTINNNLIGLITSIHLLDLVPKLVPLIRSRGLVLVASSDTNDDQENNQEIQKELDSYTRAEINGLRFDDVLSFKEDITM